MEFDVDDIPIENHRIPCTYWMPQMHKNPIKARLIITSPKSLVKPLVRTFKGFLNKYKDIRIILGILQALALFGQYIKTLINYNEQTK